MALIDKDTIRAEIERRTYNAHEMPVSRPDKQFYEGKDVAYGEILAFLDTLPDEPKDLDIPGFEGVKVHLGNIQENEPKCLWGNEPSEESCRYCSVWCSLRKPEPNSESSTNLDSKDDAVGLSIMLYLDTHVKHENSKVCGVPLKIAREWLRRHIGKDEPQMASGFFTKDIAASTDEPKRSLDLSDLLVQKQPYIPPVKEPYSWSETLPKYKLDVKPEQPVEGLEEKIEKYFQGWFNDDEYGDAVTPDYIGVNVDKCKEIARHFYDLGCRHTAVMYDDIEYERQRAEEAELSGDLEEELENYAKLYPFEDAGSYRNLIPLARHFAEWGVEHAKE